MADFDNGLPPKGVDVSDKKIATIVIDKDVSDDNEIENIKALLIDASEAETKVDNYNIETVLVDKSPSGHNRSFFF